MQTLKLSATSVYTLAPTRNVGELQAKLAKCNGKYKPTSIKADKRVYPLFGGTMSTADYVLAYERANNGNGRKSTRNLKHAGFFADLNEEPCTLYTGEDSHETIDECEVIDFPSRIDARELQGEELDAAYAEFAFAA